MSDRSSLAKGEQSTCFVIMPFGHPFDRYYRNIFVPAIQRVGMSPVRADSIFLPSQIIGDIWRFTLAASVVLADVSGKNANVFYELGLAHASGKPVVIVTSNLDDVPFDLRGLRIISYEKDNESWGAELESNIARALTETLRDPKRAVPSYFLESAGSFERPSEDPVMLQLRRLADEVRAMRAQSAAPASPPADPTRMMTLLDRHTALLHGVPDGRKAAIFESLMAGDVAAAAAVIREELQAPPARADEIARNIFDWMKLYKAV